MAAPIRIDELTASGSLSAGAAIAVVQSGGTFRTTPRAFITEAESFLQSGSGTPRTAEAKMRAIVSAEDFGATGDGTTDDSAAVIAAIAALPSTGGIVEFEQAARYKLKLGAITKQNVMLRGKNFVRNASASVQFVPADNADYILEVGDGTTSCNGFRTEGISLNGLGTGAKGIKINGADNCRYSSMTSGGFTTHGIYITSSAAVSTQYQYFDGFDLQAQNGATAIGVEIDYGSNFVAAIFFNNGNITSQASSLWALKMTRVRAFFSNVWFQGANGKCISLNTSGGTVATMECANVHVDSDSASDVLVNLDSNDRPSDVIRGLVRIDGLIALTGGNTAALTNRNILPANSYLTSCFINGSGLFFLDSNLSEWARWDQSATQMSITRNNTNFQFSNSAGGFNMVAAAGNAFAISGREIRLSDSNGQRTSALHAIASVTCSGATSSASNLIPAGSLVLGVCVRVTGAIGGATSFEIGDGTDADRWGTAIAVASGTTTSIANFTITTPVYYTSAASVVLTANGSNFSSGTVRVTVHYINLVAATS